jgi:hypothetical protein
MCLPRRRLSLRLERPPFFYRRTVLIANLASPTGR